MLTSIGTIMLTALGILLLIALLIGCGSLFFIFGLGYVRGFPDYVRTQPGTQKLVVALILGPLAAGYALVGFGLAALCALSVPLLLFAWLGTPPLFRQAEGWLESPPVSSVLGHLGSSTLYLLMGCFALGVSLACLLGLPEMVRKIRTFLDFVAVPFALGLGLAFLLISFILFRQMLTAW